MGFGALVLEYLDVNELIGMYHIPAVLAVLLGLISISWLGLRSAKAESKAEMRLRHAAEQLRAMTDNVPGVLFQWYMRPDGTQGFRYCSPRSKELFGFSSEDVIKDWHIIRIHHGDIARWAQTLQKCSETLEDWFFEGRFILPDDNIKWWRGIAKPVRDESGEVVFNGIILDVTDAKDAEREIKETRRNSERLSAEILLINQSLNETNSVLQRINAQKNEILGVAAHDLKNPLGGVVGFAGAIRVCLDNEDIQPYRTEMIDMAESIEQSARHMLHIINGLLNASALEDGAVTLDMTDCEMDMLVGSVVSMNEATAKRKGIVVRFEAEAGCVVRGDLQRLQELVDNLVSNAIKYSPSGSTAWLRVYHSAPTTVRISVRDSGPGLTDDDKKRLFGKFQKLSARPTGGESSTGLGLAIAKSIVELHNGHIWAESEPGEGSTFFVDLPVKPERPATK